MLFLPPLAQLLREDSDSRRTEEDRHLLKTGDCSQRGDHLRLQVPNRGREDPVLVRISPVPRYPELVRTGIVSILFPRQNTGVL